MSLSRRKFLHIAGLAGICSLTNTCTSPPVRLLNDFAVLPRRGYEDISTLDDLLQYYLTKKAYDKVKDVAIEYGYVATGYTGYAVGVNLWGRLASFFTGHGLSRKIILSEEGILQTYRALAAKEWKEKKENVRRKYEDAKNLDDPKDAKKLREEAEADLNSPLIIAERNLRTTILHEYLHHLDDLGHIDHDAFARAYKKIAENSIWNYLVENAESGIVARSNNYWAFGMPKISERIATVGSTCAVGELFPPEMAAVYKGVFKKAQKE